MKKLRLFYRQPAENSDDGWEKQSLPIGNGYLGANVFGRTDTERVQITENSLENPGYCEIGMMGGLNNFAEIYLDFEQDSISGYERGLDIDNAVAYVKYDCGGVHFEREYFASHPEKALFIRLTASEKVLNFKLRLCIPFIKDFALKEGDGGSKTGVTAVYDDRIEMSGTMDYYGILFAGVIKIAECDGKCSAEADGIRIDGASQVLICMTVGTNYELCERVFLEEDPKKKLRPIDPMPRVRRYLESACSYGYDELKSRHIADYRAFFGRVTLDLGEDGADIPTDELIKSYAAGRRLPYLETLYFQYGRYLLISSSRKGCLPPNLQGVWNCHDISPWGSGYWHNINIQMNYWPVFSTNLAELFESYADYFRAFLPRAQVLASEYIKKYMPENYSDGEGECGWCIGTGAYAYTIQSPGIHSGPGTGGLTSKLFFDYYDFTRDEKVLREISYPALKGMSRFLIKNVKKYGDKYLIAISASPEQMLNGRYVSNGSYHLTVGCSFDQQMTEENGRDFLKACEILGIDDEDTKKQREQIDHYDSVPIGWSGQIKEFREERLYGEIGEYNHRHLSQLMALMPGTLVNSDTDAWMDAAKYTLNERGDDSTGWALANRINAWARTGDGNRAHLLYHNLLSMKTLDNLWDTHPPFQIDGNFGGCAGVAEMLLQSHEGYIHILPCLPDVWDKGAFSGLCARGAFEVSVDWENKNAKKIVILSKKGGRVSVKYPLIGKASVYCESGESVEFTAERGNLISFETQPGKAYIIDRLKEFTRPAAPQNLNVATDGELCWTDVGLKYNVYRAYDGAAVYTRIAEKISGGRYTDSDIDFDKHEIVTYRVTAVGQDAESIGAHKTVSHATQLQLDMLKNNLMGRQS